MYHYHSSIQLVPFYPNKGPFSDSSFVMTLELMDGPLVFPVLIAFLILSATITRLVKCWVALPTRNSN